MNWLNNPTPPEGAVGFIYILKYDNLTKAYIGKKSILATKTIPALKSGEIRPGAIRATRHILRDADSLIIVSKKDRAKARKQGLKAKKELFDTITTESKWKAYESSSEDVANHTLCSKEILQWAYSKKELTYLENKWLYSEGVLEKEEYLNSNISGTIFKKDII